MKRTSLGAVKVAAEVRNRGAGGAAEPRQNESELATIRLPKRTHDLLRSVAVSRAAAGARFSFSRVIQDLAEKHRAELEREAKAS